MICNPFELDELTAINNTKKVFDATVFKGISILEATGEKQFLRFWEDRLLNGRYSVDMKIPKNSILLPRNADSKSDAFSKPTYSTSSLTKLHSAIHARKTLSIMLFSTEIGGVAQCLAETMEKNLNCLNDFQHTNIMDMNLMKNLPSLLN